jgi:hypothetical protein
MNHRMPDISTLLFGGGMLCMHDSKWNYRLETGAVLSLNVRWILEFQVCPQKILKRHLTALVHPWKTPHFHTLVLHMEYAYYGSLALSRNMRNHPRARYPQQESLQPFRVVDMNHWRWWLRLQRLDTLHWCGTADREGQDNEIVIMDLGFQHYIEELLR